ncbi:hypothetical protein K9N68_06085 [Kovacikia minuta CCNUW1]|uniref:hypothetical protein n=1 Tax=Kovacikia minuta TaxID=2931930 RepID=UPI001CCD0BD7|nr:hypothetical protein [Kovacikia minuta]UBF27508.1 hypothetical protein K9N68_06085 [Kovacikia minuta CCNUW1]
MQGILWAVIQASDSLSTMVPRFEVVQSHHITLQYGVELATWAQWVGYEFEAIATEECWSDRIQALQVTLPTTIPCINPHPHITISHRIDVEPQEANAMLADFHQSTPIQLIIPVKIEFYSKALSAENQGNKGIEEF